MKKITSFLVIILFLTGCGQKDENEMTFDTISIDKVINLSNEDSSPTCSVHLSMAYATEDNGPKAEVFNNAIIQKLFNQQDVTMEFAAQQFVNSYTEAYLKNMLPLYNQDRADTTKRSWYEYHYIITTSTQKGSKGTIVYLATVDYYEGGAHSVNQLLPMNFYAQSGQQIKLSNIFVSGFEKQLTKVLLQALEEKTGTTSKAQLREKGFLVSMELFPTENFILSDETITFIYNPSEIAPYTAGNTELIIPYTQLQAILKNSFEY